MVLWRCAGHSLHACLPKPWNAPQDPVGPKKGWRKVLGMSRSDPVMPLFKIIVDWSCCRKQVDKRIPTKAFPFAVRTMEKANFHLSYYYLTSQNSGIFQCFSSLFSKLSMIKPRDLVPVIVKPNNGVLMYPKLHEDSHIPFLLHGFHLSLLPSS